MPNHRSSTDHMAIQRRPRHIIRNSTTLTSSKSQDLPQFHNLSSHISYLPPIDLSLIFSFLSNCHIAAIDKSYFSPPPCPPSALVAILAPSPSDGGQSKHIDLAWASWDLTCLEKLRISSRRERLMWIIAITLLLAKTNESPYEDVNLMSSLIRGLMMGSKMEVI